MKFNKIALVASAFAFAALGGCAESEQEAQEDLVEQQYSYQESLGQKCCVIVFDPFQTTRGRLVCKALRLTTKFMALWKENAFRREDLAGAVLTGPNEVWEELPLRVRNPHLMDALCPS